ncbi:GAF domain-containing protein [Pimelobacter simplex]|uniref:GAF domain-containing protein n=1 Tax=Nocardioides simplex TaxID=2045 RepID=UPI00215031F1|nr:GAF domain-containing protein [Pimelobacter simplex]UUW90437.1 GAF domain-containing protein [Pimelobacter simplex]UUW94267.1 GAF domain-containing protein [Pimelobacter simplex]
MSPDAARPHMRAEVAASWERSAAAGVEVGQGDAPITLETPDLRGRREAHPLARVFPLLDDVLGREVRDCGAVMALADAEGTLLWVCGTPETLRQAERIGFVEGSNWDERLVGTNAPGLALATGREALVTREEHFRSAVRSWSCAATPIHDPLTSRLLGVLDVTGGDALVVPQTMAMVRAAARLAEAELARQAPPPPAPTDARTTGVRLLLELLGHDEALVTVDDGRARLSRIRLSRRHSEIVALLAATPGGLTGDELAVLLYEEDGGTSTLRAELNRLRGLLGDELLASRPYRLTAPVTGDWLAVEAQLAAGDLRAAMQGYGGPVLPRSTAPGIVALRERLAASVRQALLRSGTPELMSAWTRSGWGRDDYEMWLAQRSAVPATSPMRALVEGQLARLDAELG